jgi:hypothetical protein
MIRNGNHFIYMGGGEWCLIDGPWFDYLESFQHTHLPIHLERAPGMPLRLVGDDARPPIISSEKICWEPRRWHPGYHSVLGEPRLQLRWLDYQKERTRIGYMLLPDGKVPPFIDGDLPADEEIEIAIEQEEAKWKKRRGQSLP